jgi:hypothetical protein
MPRAPIIGIHGRKRSGKDTAGTLLQPILGGYLYAFADPLYQMLAPFGIRKDDPYWGVNKDTPLAIFGGRSLRYVLQTLGTEWGRNTVSEDLWVTMAQLKFHSVGPGMIITDVRMPNEAAWVRKQGGVILHMRRREADQVVDLHDSEKPLPLAPTDMIVENNGTIADLQQTLQEMFLS